MVQPKVYASLDIGTTSVKVVVAEYVNQHLNVIGVGSERSEGLSRGVIVDIDKTVEAIKSAVRQAERKSNCEIKNVIVGVPCNQVNIEPCYGMIAVANENREITDKDVNNVLSAAKVRAVPPEREIISVIPEEFVVDGFDGIRDPRGMIGVRLELYASMITGTKTIIHNIRRCVENAGLNIADLVVQPLATAAAALSEGERDFGTIIIDMGGGQTSASVIHDKQLKFAYIDQEGGEYITKDISTVLNTTIENAEQIKLEYGYADSRHTSENEFFPVEIIGKKEPAKVDEHYLSEIIEARVMQILETIKRALDQVEAFDLPGGVVITGGAAALPGVIDLASEYFETEVRFYIPEHVGLRNPMFATAVGLVEYASGLEEIYHVAQGYNFDNRSRDAAKQEEESYTRPQVRAYEPEVDHEVQAESVPEAPYASYEEELHEEESRGTRQAADHAAKEGNEGFADKVKSFFEDIFN
ncbi:cell division protein FtsA [Aerococcus sanguinicola]|uniref:cell division protein FtsA n=1 Tax=unclassified Aerococcus TaxID=2618060 RepID=UPI0008A3DCC0|nr:MULTISPECIES: cell division protein FtsA [unclassified Aerococcus]KAB0647751.1 cell division protein FtsA [Aerococcus sanguinicola]MDK6233007.1 cell division protein FtsA [Aerococcus sp. UMB10185]MDK6804549.1 cell division protein FtsA [Aerococcus sp. UMB7834]MDK6855301.1 cell division protein FtsA [Aerococcus sp. UMB7533]MDK8502157.1 cell division protein FtsA [Aerococcus sp. UMB1112A]